MFVLCVLLRISHKIPSRYKNAQKVEVWRHLLAAVLLLFSLPVSVRYEKIKFLVIALKNAVEVYAWAPKPYHKFMAFKVCIIKEYKKKNYNVSFLFHSWTQRLNLRCLVR